MFLSLRGRNGFDMSAVVAYLIIVTQALHPELSEIVDASNALLELHRDVIFSAQDLYSSSRCGLLRNFEKRLEEFYNSPESDGDELLNRNCVSALRMYQGNEHSSLHSY